MTGRYVLACIIALALCCTRYAYAPIVKPEPTLGKAIDVAWKVLDGQEPPPYITLVSGPDLTCSNGEGFVVPITGCVYGITLSPHMCVVAYTGKKWHETALAHELLHAVMWQRGWVDINHVSDEWKPGGLLEQANAELERNGL